MAPPDIASLIPHAGPMILLDRVVSVDAEVLVAQVTIRADSLFCRDGGVGSWVGIEYMAQAIAAHAGYASRQRGEPVRVGFLLGSRRYECARPLFALGSVLSVHAHCLLQSETGLGSFDCRIEQAGAILATGTLTVFRPGANDHSEEGKTQ